MGRLAEQEAMHRLRVNVPYDDVVITKWWEAQHNPSMSIRELVRRDIRERNGDFLDTFATPDGTLRADAVGPDEGDKPKRRHRKNRVKAPSDVSVQVVHVPDEVDARREHEPVADSPKSVETAKPAEPMYEPVVSVPKHASSPEHVASGTDVDLRNMMDE